MYLSMVITLMLVLPVASIAWEGLTHGAPGVSIPLLGKWFVFWAVGVRLLLAGLRQILQPRYTAETILGVKDPDARLIVRELGFANVAIGGAGVCTLYFAVWSLPVAVIGAIFYALAGINHATHRRHTALQAVAMISDLFAAALLLLVSVAAGRVSLP